MLDWYADYYGDDTGDDGDSTNDDTDEPAASPRVNQAGGGDGPPGGEGPECMEDVLERIRQNAVDMSSGTAGGPNDGPPLCFALATIFDWGVGDMSEPVCMHRCGWDEDCNYYMNMDDDDMMDVEMEVCAGADVSLHEGCFDMGFCDSTGEARDWKFWLWPYDAEDEFAAEHMAHVYYWMPWVPTSPAGCQLTYAVASKKNTDWEWDMDFCDEEMVDRNICPSLKLTPVLLDEGSTWEIYIKVKVGVEGTNVAKNFYQFF